jgi:hypothetical protein
MLLPRLALYTEPGDVYTLIVAESHPGYEQCRFYRPERMELRNGWQQNLPECVVAVRPFSVRLLLRYIEAYTKV